MLTPDLLRQLAEAGLGVDTNPDSGRWFAGGVRREPSGGYYVYGDVGPCDTAEQALVAGVKWLWVLADDRLSERDELLDENRQLRQEVERLRAALKALQAERLRQSERP